MFSGEPNGIFRIRDAGIPCDTFDQMGECDTIDLKWTPDLGPWIAEVKV